jgi:AhpD family alkylhydroperoxidase
MVLAREARSSYRAMRELDGSLAEYGLDNGLLLLVQTRASQVNGCAFCIDMHIKEAVALGESIQRCYSLDAWRETSYYTAQERAALALTEAMTTLAPGGVPDAVWDEAAAQFETQQLAGLVMAIVSINAWNRMAITTRAPVPGSYQPSG